MTMRRAQIFLGVSIVITAFAAFLVFSQIQLFDPVTASSRVPGAGAGNSPVARATQAGGDIAATITAAAGTVTLPTPTAGTRTATATAAPPIVGIGQPIEFRGSRYTVNQVVDPEPPGFFSTATGKRRVAVELTQEAVGAPAAYDFTYFALRDVSGADYTWAISNSKPELDRGTIKAGESHRGWLVFQVPFDVTPVTLVVAPSGSGGRTAIVDLRK
jgi:hypothetical protein